MDCSRSVCWFDSKASKISKGLAVLAYGDYSVEPHPAYREHHKMVVPVIVKGPTAFLLFAVWTIGRSGEYVIPLMDAFEEYKSLMTEKNVIWAGDFNANISLDVKYRPKKWSFQEFVDLMQKHGIESLYHLQHPNTWGQEVDHTYCHHRHANEGFHIDYVFASESLRRNGCNVEVETHAEWGTTSDHMPVICDFHENPRN